VALPIYQLRTVCCKSNIGRIQVSENITKTHLRPCLDPSPVNSAKVILLGVWQTPKRAIKASDSASGIHPSPLYLGPCSSASSQSFLTSNSINNVLSIGITPSLKVDGVTYHRLGLKLATDALKSNKGRGRILVHFSAGVSRSPTIVVAYLMKHWNMALRTALGHVVRIRPQVSPNPGFIEQCKDMEMELYKVSTLDYVKELPRREVDRIALFNQVDKPGKSSNTSLLQGESQPPEMG